jgi:hypothetical protein
MVRQWEKNYAMLRNRYWPTGRPGWLPSPQTPEIWPIVRSRVAYKTDRRFRHTIAPASPSFTDLSRVLADMGNDLGAVMDAGFHANGEERELSIMLADVDIYGIGFIKTFWDPTAADGMGDAVMRRCDPHTIYPDPQARSDKDMTHILEVRQIPLSELDRMIPGSAKKIRDGMWEQFDDPLDQLGQPYARLPRANPGALSPATTPRYGLPGQSQLHVSEDFGVTLIEAWLRDHKHTTDANGNVKTRDVWRVVMIANNRVIFDEPASALWMHGTHPYSRHVPFDVGEFWGFSMVQMLTSTQESINRLLAAMQQNIELVGNPVWQDAEGQERQQITNRPGVRLTSKQLGPGQQAGWVNPPPWHPGMFDLLIYHLQRLEAVAGMSAAMRGRSDKGRPSGMVVETLQESAFAVIRDELRALQWAMTDAGYRKASLICENYTEDRLVAAVGEDGRPNMIELKARHFQLARGKDRIPMRYQLLVDAGANQPTARAAREDQIITLFGLGLIDEEAALEALQFQNWPDVAARVIQKKATGAMQPPGARQRSRRAA